MKTVTPSASEAKIHVGEVSVVIIKDDGSSVRYSRPIEPDGIIVSLAAAEPIFATFRDQKSQRSCRYDGASQCVAITIHYPTSISVITSMMTDVLSRLVATVPRPRLGDVTMATIAYASR